MTNKFSGHDVYDGVREHFQFYDNESKKRISNEKVLDLLNELYEENQSLKGKASSWKITASEEIMEQENLIKEVVGLKDEIKQLKKKLNTFNEVNELYKKENELRREENKMLSEQIGDDYNEANSMTVKISELEEENKEIKELIHTMLTQIDVEKIGSDCNTVYSARIIFTGREYKKITEIWNMRD